MAIVWSTACAIAISVDNRSYMPKHRPIRFKEPEGLEELKLRVNEFTQKHPVATSAMKVVLALALAGGVITVAVAAPGITTLFGRERYSRNKELKDRYKRLWKSFHNLKKKNVFEFKGEDKDGFQVYQLSGKGSALAKKFALETLTIATPKKWDGYWRIVFFDIPEKYKKARQALQLKLKEMGFYCFQKSAWIYPFPCEGEIAFLKDVFNIHPFVEIIETKEIKNGKVIYRFQRLLKDFY